MSKTSDTSITVAIIILILFAIVTIIYIFNSNVIKDNSTDSLDNNIYFEHVHQETTNDITVQKVYVYEDIATYTTQIQDKDKNRI